MNKREKSIHSDVTKTKILVVDDRPVVREGLTIPIDCQADGVVVARAGTADQAISGEKKHALDMTIVDMLFKQTTDAPVTRKIKALRPNLVARIASMSDEKCHIQQAFEAKAAGAIANDEVSESMIDAIRQVLNGKSYLSGRLSKLFSKPRLDKLLT